MATISFQCYSCHQVLKVGGDKAGKRGKCPKCGTMLTIPFASSEAPPAAAPPPAPQPAPVPQPAYPAPQPAYPVPQPGYPAPQAPYAAGPPPAAPLRAEPVEDEPFAPPPHRQAGGGYDEPEDAGPVRTGNRWGMVSIGLLIVFIAFCDVALGFGLHLIGDLLFTVMVIGRTGSMGMLETSGRLMTIGDWFTLFGVLGAIPGYVLCNLCPNKHGTLPLAITTTALAGASFLVELIARFGMRGEVVMGMVGGGTGFIIVMLFAKLLFCGHIIVFPLYLGGVLRARKRSRYDKKTAMAMAIAYTGMVVLVILLGFLLASSRMERGGEAMVYVMLLLRWIVNGLFIAFLMSFIIHVWNVRSVAT
jgi:hypothetical protein